MRPEGFSKACRIRLQADIDRLLREGVRNSDSLLVVVVRRNGLKHTRLGVRVPGRVGRAVYRNRVRRRLREAFRRCRDRLPVGTDILCIVKPHKGHAFAALRDSLIRLTGLAATRLPARPPA